MAVKVEKDKCCGCMACMNICPKGAISATKDEDGFLYPYIDRDKCIECHLCEKVCSFSKEDNAFNTPMKAYSLVHKDKNVLYNSTSGGAFTALSDSVLKQGGVIFGACMDDRFDVKHKEAVESAARDGMRGAIYVQSFIDNTYRAAKKYLDQGNQVLFVGTPCQIGGLMSFLQKPYENLIGVEFLCHGVPNNDFFKQHIRFLEEKYSDQAKWYTFRDKKYAWWTHGIEEITFKSGKQKSAKAVQAYNKFFHSNVSLRPSCLNCTYRRVERAADITIADFWGIDKITGKKNAAGVSLLFGNTEKGLAFIEALNQNEIDISEVPVERVIYRISTKHVKPSGNTVEFWKCYHEHGYKALVDQYTDTSIQAELRFGLKRLFARNH